MIHPTAGRLRVINVETSNAGKVAIYRPFFVAGLITVLTAGCLLGAFALFGISLAGSFTQNEMAPYVWAHANSQLFGWVSFFVIGFTYQQHHLSEQNRESFNSLAWATLGLMSVGISLRFAAEPLFPIFHSFGMAIGILASSCQIAAVLLFVYLTSKNAKENNRPLSWQTLFIFASSFWFVISSFSELLAFLGSHQSSATCSLMFVAKWFVPLRDVQFLGFVACMVFGVSLIKFSSCFYFKEPKKIVGMIGFIVWNCGIILRTIGWLSQFDKLDSQNQSWIVILGNLCLALGAICVALSSRVFAEILHKLPSHKFIRSAYFCLCTAGILFLVEPLYLNQMGIGFSHAYSGAIRHAITVGFISQMIVGVGTHVVCRMNSLPETKTPAFHTTFWLLNVGNAVRVFSEILTEQSVVAFKLMGITGFVEFTGLLVWGIWMYKAMNGKPLCQTNFVPRIGS